MLPILIILPHDNHLISEMDRKVEGCPGFATQVKQGATPFYFTLLGNSHPLPQTARPFFPFLGQWRMTARELEGRGIRADSLRQIKFRTQYIRKLKTWTLIPLSIPMYPLGSLCVPLTSRFHVSEVRKKVVPLTETQRSEERAGSRGGGAGDSWSQGKR